MLRRVHVRAHAREPSISFTVVFYGLKIFGCKTAQVCVKRREVCWSKDLASATVCKPVKTGAKTLS